MEEIAWGYKRYVPNFTTQLTLERETGVPDRY